MASNLLSSSLTTTFLLLLCLNSVMSSAAAASHFQDFFKMVPRRTSPIVVSQSSPPPPSSAYIYPSPQPSPSTANVVSPYTPPPPSTAPVSLTQAPASTPDNSLPSPLPACTSTPYPPPPSTANVSPYPPPATPTTVFPSPSPAASRVHISPSPEPAYTAPSSLPATTANIVSPSPSPTTNIVSPSPSPTTNIVSLSPSTPASTGAICKLTPYPSYCRSSVLPHNNSATVYDSSKFSVSKSLTYAKKFLSLIEKYLYKSSSLTPSAVAALHDCLFLAQLNIDFLQSSSLTVNATTSTLPVFAVDDVQTFLSAILTNTETCLDGLKGTASAWSVKKNLTMPLSNSTQLYSVSLALFAHGWVHKKKKRTGIPTGTPIPAATSTSQSPIPFPNGELPFKMSPSQQTLYKSVGNRRLLEDSGDELVQINVREIVVVSKDGKYNFTTINDAVSSAPNNTPDASYGYYVIYITAGVYQEYVSIPKNTTYLMMVGAGKDKTVITGNRSVADGWTTFNSPTFAVVAQGFVAVDIGFRNTAGPAKFQAVAVRNGADFSTFYDCAFRGYQDTLYAHSLRQFYRNCDIYGTIDFIFGNAAAVFQECTMFVRLPLSYQFNTVTAQGRSDPNQNTGYSFQYCKIKAANGWPQTNSSIQTYLGRPWHLYSTTVFMQSFMDSLINPLGWAVWNGDFALNTSYYAEFDNTGPGSNTSGRVNWPGYHIINVTGASNFTVSNFLLGQLWLNQTGVPYKAGLIK